MTDGEIVRAYKQAKDKKAQIRIMGELTLKPKEEIVRILKENGCEVEEKRRGRKPKADESDAEEKPRTQRKRRNGKEEQGSSAGETADKGGSSGEKQPKAAVPEKQQLKAAVPQRKAQGGSSSVEKDPTGSSGIPEGVRIALKEKAESASFMIKTYREKIEECTKTVHEILEYALSIGISEIDLLR